MLSPRASELIMREEGLVLAQRSQIASFLQYLLPIKILLVVSSDASRISWEVDPKADVLYDVGSILEVLSPLCLHLFLEMAGLSNFAKGMEIVAARTTRLPFFIC